MDSFKDLWERFIFLEIQSTIILRNWLDNTIFYYKYVITSPSKLVRTSLAVQETLDQILSIRKAWRFAWSDRRVRRLPELAYAAIQPDTHGLAAADMVEIYKGASNRYKWTLLGKV